MTSETGKPGITLFTPGTYEIRWTSIHVLFIGLIGVLWFQKNPSALYHNLDSAFRMVLDRYGREFGEFGSILNAGPHFGLGSVMSFVDPHLEPTHLIFEVTGSAVTVYIFLAVTLFLAAYVLARSLGFSGFTSRLAGWILTLAFIPFHPAFVADWAATMSPYIPFMLAVQTVAVAIFIRIGRMGRWPNILGIASLVTLVAYLVVVDIHHTMMFVPVSFLLVIAITAASRSRQEVIYKAAAVAGMAAVVMVLDVGTILDNFTSYSARLTQLWGHSDPADVLTREYYATVLYKDYFPRNGHFLGAPVLGWLGFAGLIFTFVHALKSGARQRLALAFVAFGCMSGLYAVSREYMIPDIVWPWASPNYFEYAVYPAYAVTGAFLFVKFFGLYVSLGNRDLWTRSGLGREIFGGDGADQAEAGDGGEAMRRSHRHEVLFFLAMFAAVTLGGLLPNPVKAIKNAAATAVNGPPTWPARDAVIDELADKIPLRLDSPFRGYLEDLTGMRLTFHNIMSWNAGIATLSSHFRSLDFFSNAYLVEFDFGSKPRPLPISKMLPLDRQIELFRALGVAYVTLDRPVEHPNLVPVPGWPKSEKFLAKSVILDWAAFIWPHTERSHLYRMRSPNLGQYSPTQAIKVRDWAAFTGMLASKPIDWERSFVVHGPAGTSAWADGPLVKADDIGPMVIVKNGVAVKAATVGRSLILLPRQFSNCYRWQGAPASSAKVRIVRVNLYQMGIVFEGRIEGALKYHYKWGGDLSCAARDIAEAYDMGVAREGYVRPGHMGPFAKILLWLQRRSLAHTLERGRAKK